ncbi:MAG: hypothetical protein AAGA58_11765 [Verrucomicrobiota bacterium]
MARFLIIPLTLVALFTAARANAQADPNQHEATKVVVSYLRYSMAQEFEKSAALLDEVSLQSLQARFIERVKMAPTIDDEMAMVRRLDKTSLREVEAMEPTEFYIAYHNGLQARYEVDQELLDQIVSTTSVKVMSVSEEVFDDSELAHVLVRTRHDNRDKEVTALDLISLKKYDGVWRVHLHSMEPQVRDREMPEGLADDASAE